MTKKQKLDLLVKIMTVFNNTFLAASFILGAFIVPIGTICSASTYLFVGLILAFTFRKLQNFTLTVLFWLPAMSFQKVTEWIQK